MVRLLFVTGRIRGRSYTSDLCLALPVMGIDSLDEFLEAGKCCGLLVVDHIILDPFGEAVVSLLE